jgi:hypothetical protein
MNTRDEPYPGWLETAVTYPIVILSRATNVSIFEDL